jgi:Dimerisation domain
MVKLIWGYGVSQVVRAVADLSIADHLVDGPLTANEIARREETVADYTLRLMRAAVAIGLVEFSMITVDSIRLRQNPGLQPPSRISICWCSLKAVENVPLAIRCAARSSWIAPRHGVHDEVTPQCH